MAAKILQCGYMSGDTYSAAALLAADPSVEIVLVIDKNATGQYADKSGLIKKIYAESGVADRVHDMDITGKLPITTLWKAVSSAYKDRKPAPDPRGTSEEAKIYQQLYQHRPVVGWPRSITAVTGLLATKWSADPSGTQKKVATAWKVGKLPTEQKFALYEFMGTKFAKTGFDIRKNIVVLWSRQSGKRGGAHLELDSSFVGIRQLAYYFAERSKRATVLLAGDERNSKLADFAKTSGQIIDVAEMWEAPVWKTHFGTAKFLAQFAFYKYLADEYNVVHVGMRSGMLESMALLGMTTFYLEDYGSGSGDRMVAFSSAGITYRRIQIRFSPGITGRITQRIPVFTKEAVENRIENKADFHKSRGGFRYNFGRAGEKTDRAARDYAKAALVGVKLDDRSYDKGDQWMKLKDDMTSLRGFTKTDVDAIVKLVEGAFK